jgi:predicted amidohydrolase YtcJ
MRNREADLVFHNGRVITLGSKKRIFEALAVKNNLIVPIGSNQDI